MDVERSAGSLDRRRFIRNVGIAAWAAPAILTMTSGRANAQVPDCTGSLLPRGCACTASDGCVGDCCCSLAGEMPGVCLSPADCDDVGGDCV